MPFYYRISEAAQRLGVGAKTIRRWDAKGKIECIRTIGGHRRISILEIARLTNQQEKFETPEREVAIYCRVSSADQKKKGDLARQVQVAHEHCYQQGYPNPHLFQDVGSGLKADRRGLKKLCRLIDQGKISRVILTYPDRVTRFGFDYLSNYFSSHGTDIQMINEPISRSMEEELVQELVAFMTAFSGRVHSMRSGKNRKKKQKKDKGKTTSKAQKKQKIMQKKAQGKHPQLIFPSSGY